MSNRDEYIEQVKNRLDHLNAQVDELEARIEQAQGDTKDKYEESIHALQQYRQSSQEELNALMAAGEDQWEALKDQAEHTWKVFQDSIHYFMSRL